MNKSNLEQVHLFILHSSSSNFDLILGFCVGAISLLDPGLEDHDVDLISLAADIATYFQTNSTKDLSGTGLKCLICLKVSIIGNLSKSKSPKSSYFADQS